MSKRAEQRALEAYPNLEPPTFDETYPRILFTRNTERRAYVEGYEQAEKDLSLTLEDIELLRRLFVEEEDNFSKHDKYFYTEVLNRFNKSKEGE